MKVYFYNIFFDCLKLLEAGVRHDRCPLKQLRNKDLAHGLNRSSDW